MRGLHNMGTAIGDEIRLQDGLLDQLGNDVDARGNMQSTAGAASSSEVEDNWKMCTIVLLIVGLGVVLSRDHDRPAEGARGGRA